VNEFQGISPTHKRVKISGVNIVEVESCKIKLIKDYENSPEYLLNQLRE
jgi:hypothetical protein